MFVNGQCMNDLEIAGNKPKQTFQIPLAFSTPVPKSILILFYRLLRTSYLFIIVYFFCFFSTSFLARCGCVTSFTAVGRVLPGLDVRSSILQVSFSHGQGNAQVTLEARADSILGSANLHP